ncbi:hypothetical protein [Umezawaea tangerina]|uniref:hypothetical protein n=1 Tax=Umezawaea tangerina TaxID=84725 RepID=UPI000D0651AF
MTRPALMKSAPSSAWRRTSATAASGLPALSGVSTVPGVASSLGAEAPSPGTRSWRRRRSSSGVPLICR